MPTFPLLFLKFLPKSINRKILDFAIHSPQVRDIEMILNLSRFENICKGGFARGLIEYQVYPSNHIVVVISMR
jgi:hypothetical protein